MTKVYRRVPALEIDHDVIKVQGHEIYDAENEGWEFIPGTLNVTQRELEREMVLVATSEKEKG
jgi:hypothetical protein